LNDRLPYSEEAERALLACALMDETACGQAIENVKARHFFKMAHSDTFSAIIEIVSAGGTVDVVTISDKLKDMGKLSSVGGFSFVGGLVDYIDSAENVKDYIRIVKDKHSLRSLLEACREIEQAVYKDSDAEEILAFAENRIVYVVSDLVKKETKGVSDILWPTLEEIERRMENEGEIPGTPTGFRRLDQYTSGLKPGQLVTIAGRPAMGKTSLALNVALNAAVTHGVGVVVFSLEMNESELMERMLCSEARVDSTGLRVGRLSESEMKRLATAAGLINEAPIFINDSAGMTPLEMKSHVRRIQQTHEIGLVIVDYLQLMSLGDHRFTGNRVAEVSKLSRDLKVLARDLEVPVVALSQLNRGVEQRDEKRPLLSDLRESGSIEQDSDIVMFVFREEVYKGATNKKGENIEGKAEIIISKQRNGPTGKVSFDFHKEYTRFEEREPVYVANTDTEVYGGDEEVQDLGF